ncbi:hypothetical protein B566_EDAN001894 [Ephemera danica]|nr:hypothetical protein B566_EDAN001894 [Ephemera danica]
MADIKKIALNTIGAPKKEKKSKSVSKTVRFSLTLGESNEKSCPEFNYKELLAAEGNKSKPNGALPLDVDDDDEAGVRALARKFEEKYGGGGGHSSGGKRKKRKRNEDYVDLGAGYDDNDSFIDNTDAYDEIVPEEMTTAQGGFYINCGKLVYKQLEIPDEPDEPPSDNEEVQHSRKQARQAIASSDESSDDEEEDDEDEDSRDEELPSESEPKLSVTPLSKLMPPSKPPEEARKLKRPAEMATTCPAKKKTATVKDLLKEKRDIATPPPLIVNLTSKVPASSSSIADSIESVIAAYVEPKQAAPPPAVTAPPEPIVEPPLRLPEGLSESIKSQAELLRKVAIENGGVTAKFFASSNRALIRLDQKTQSLPPAVRHQVFAYIAEKVVCSAEALMKKARKLHKEKARAKEPLIKLKAAIDQLSPAVLESYQEECQKFNKNRFIDGGEVCPLIPPPKFFPWPQELRTVLGEAISSVTRPGDEHNLKSFLETQVCPLFPSGWMNISTLLYEAQAIVRTKEVSRATVVTTPSSPPQRSTSVITLAESPRLVENVPRPAPQSTPISLKQRILQDAVGGAFQQDDIGLPWQVKSEPPALQTMPLNFTQKPTMSEPKSSKSCNKEKQRPSSKPPVAKQDKVSQDTPKTSRAQNMKKKWSDLELMDMLKEAEPPPPPPPAPSTHDELEDKKKLIEETNAATDYLSQIIHESLSGFPNAETNKEEHIEYRPRERKHSEHQHHHHQQQQHQQSRQTPEPPGLDPEVSVQLEMKRVMQELMELNGQMCAASEPPKLSPIHERLKSPERSLYEGGRSRVDKARSLNSSINSEVSISPANNYSTTPPDKRNSGVSVIAVNENRNMNPIYGGFQEEFQRHLMQEPPEVVLVSSSPPSAFRPSPSRQQQQQQQANPYFSQPLPAEDLRTSYYNQVQQHLNSHGRMHPYPDLQPK